MFTTDGSGFRNDSLLFGEVNAGYPAEFNFFSRNRIFAPAGAPTPAVVTGYGVVFTDVDRAGTAKIELFAADGTSLGAFDAPARSDAGGLSFVGAVFAEPIVASAPRGGSGEPLRGGSSGLRIGPFAAASRARILLGRLRSRQLRVSSFPGARGASRARRRSAQRLLRRRCAHRRCRLKGLLRGVRVLVVDDEAVMRRILAMMLELYGARVTAATSTDEALRCLAEQPYDVLLSDIRMPGEDGYTLIERVRALPPEARGSIPAIAVTAFREEETVLRTVRAGYQLHLAKPVDPGELLRAIRILTPDPHRPARNDAAAGW